MKSWILVANSSQAKLFESENLRAKELKLVKELDHPESREKGTELTSDRPGHFQTDHKARSAYEKSNPKQEEAEVFAVDLAKLLKDEFNKNKYEQLIVYAAPQFYGMLKNHLHFLPEEYSHISKDYTKLNAVDLAEQLYKDFCELK